MRSDYSPTFFIVLRTISCQVRPRWLSSKDNILFIWHFSHITCSWYNHHPPTLPTLPLSSLPHHYQCQSVSYPTPSNTTYLPTWHTSCLNNHRILYLKANPVSLPSADEYISQVNTKINLFQQQKRPPFFN